MGRNLHEWKLAELGHDGMTAAPNRSALRRAGPRRGRSLAHAFLAAVMVASTLLPATMPASAVLAGGDPPELPPPDASAEFTLIDRNISIAITSTIAAIMIPNLIEARKGSNEAAAIGAMRTLSTAQTLFREGDKDNNGVLDYAVGLDQLGGTHLIDDGLASGEKQGYRFALQAYLPPATREFQWAAVARPAEPHLSGDRSFYIDETGILLGSDNCSASANDTPLGNSAPKPASAESSEDGCEDESGAVHATMVGMLSSLDLLSNGQLLPALQGAFSQMTEESIIAILIGLDTDGDGAISFQDLLENPMVLAQRSANMMAGDQEVPPSPVHDSFFDVFTDFSFAMGEVLKLGAANEVVDFTVPIASLAKTALRDAVGLLASVHPLDHFKCYGSQSSSVDDVVSLQDAFDVAAGSFETVKVLNAMLFCNPTAKLHWGADPTSTAINNPDGHLAGYIIAPVFQEPKTTHTAVVTNQFGANQIVTVRAPRFLLVPSQKTLVDGTAPATGGGEPEGLDHYKCYNADARRLPRATVRLTDQFDAANSLPPNVTVGALEWFCNPTRKIHHDFEHNVVVGISDAGTHLACYAITQNPAVHAVGISNQFGERQELKTQKSELLCVPSVARTPHANPQVTAGFDLLKAQIAALSSGLLSRGQGMSFGGKLDKAEAAYADGQICMAVGQMDAFLAHAQDLRAGALDDDDDDDTNEHQGQGHDHHDADGDGVDDHENGLGHQKFGGGEDAVPPVDPDRVALADQLFAAGSMLESSFFDSFFDVFFDVFVEPSACFDARAGMSPEIVIAHSDNQGFEATVKFGSPRLLPALGGGAVWVQYNLPGVEGHSLAVGLPAIPDWQGLVAIPNGASAVFSDPPEPSLSAQPVHVNLFPAQTEAADAAANDNTSTVDPAFVDPPFAMDTKAYQTNAFVPPDPCKLTPVGQYRDLQMAQISCGAGAYNPVTDELRMYSSISFKIAFRGGNGTFVTDRSMSPFESAPSLYHDAALNHAVIDKYVQLVDLSNLRCAGEELLILTHPDFRSAADNLSAWKEEKGIATTVIEVGAGSDYTTGDEIDQLIEDRYDDCIVRPSYVLLLGDSEFVPPSKTTWDSTFASCGGCGDATTGSDWGYAVYVQILFDAFFPDFGVARIPVDTIAEANTVVNKVISYESDPPFIDFGGGGPFYTTAGFASVFQCCLMNADGTPAGGLAGRDQRAFIQTSEVARDTLLAAGKSVQRMYAKTVDGGGYCLGNACPPSAVQQPYSGSTTPNRYNSGALMPVDLRSGSGFAWTATSADVVASINAGRFLFLHRGHGNAGGWGDPNFGAGNLGSLTNGELLPVMYSVNCASAKWDQETDSGATGESFMEQILMKSGGGIVGGLGDNRNSPTWANNALTRGFFDATWPGLAPEYGGATSHRRLADILNHGKVYMITQVGVAQYAGDVDLGAALGEYIMWHAFGDPTLEMWTANPHRLSLDTKFTFAIDGKMLSLAYAKNGTMITAWISGEEGMQAYGRGFVVDGMVTIPPIDPDLPAPSSEDLVFSASFPNAVSVMLREDNDVGEIGISPPPAGFESAPGGPLSSAGPVAGSLSVAPSVSISPSVSVTPALGTEDRPVESPLSGPASAAPNAAPPAGGEATAVDVSASAGAASLGQLGIAASLGAVALGVLLGRGGGKPPAPKRATPGGTSRGDRARRPRMPKSLK